MDRGQYTTLMDVLRPLPDPRKDRGKRYPWLLLLTLVVVGLASGQQTAHAIAQWVVLHADTLRVALPDLLRLPSESPLLRAVRQIDHRMLEQAVAQLNHPQTAAEERVDLLVTPAGTLLQAQAVDGKAARGASDCGSPLTWSVGRTQARCSAGTDGCRTQAQRTERGSHAPSRP